MTEQLKEYDTDTDEPRKRSRGIYLLPNLMTTIALFAGFAGIIAALSGDYERSAAAIFIAMLFDGLDGRVARMTNTSSDFGKEYDSLSDMVVFGVAPALIMYQWSLVHLADWPWIWKELGWAAAFFYTASAALRLAKFNTMANDGTADKRFFSGLPSPMAAALTMGCVWAATHNGFTGAEYPLVALIITVMAGGLMVAKIPFRSFKEFNLGGKVKFFTLIVVVGLIILIAINPAEVLFFAVLLYVLFGIFSHIRRRVFGIRGRKAEESNHE